jgi:hypothetical protein
MLIKKKVAVETPPISFAALNYLHLDEKLTKQFTARAFKLLFEMDRALGDTICDYLHRLIQRTEASELFQFTKIHDQMHLYRTLREFITISLPPISGHEELKLEIIDIASQLLTQAYCNLHEPNNRKHHNSYWAYNLGLELFRAMKPILSVATAQPLDSYRDNDPDMAGEE